LGIAVIVRDLSLMEPPDLVGMPRVAGDVTTFAPPSFLPRSGRGILVFEELNRCPRYMRASCLELLTARRLNDYVLPEGWVPMAAINPAGDGHIDADELDIALLSRFIRAEVTASVDEWCLWARNNRVHEQVVQFVEQGSGALGAEGPSPRSWAYASDVLTAWENEADGNMDVLAAALSGLLDDNWALAFLQFYNSGSKPLTGKLIIRHYPAFRAALKRWVADAKLDVVAASLESLKRHLQPQRRYEALVEQSQKKANVEAFFGDLPPDLKRQLKEWLAERGYTELSVPRRATR
jgi:hypothetical protein